MLQVVPNGDDDQLVLRSHEKWVNVSVGLVFLAVGLGIVIYQFSGITLLVLALAASMAYYFLCGMPALKVWTFDRTTDTVRYEREAAYGSPRTSTYAFSDIVEMRLSSPVPAWLVLLAVLGSQPTSTPTLTMKVREGERIKRYIVATHLDRKALEQQLKEIKEFVGMGKQKNSVEDTVS
jgi:hypothetical protein